MNLHRIRWAVRGALFLGVAASVVANVLHAIDNPISQAIAAWPPLALLITVELISRVPVTNQLLAIGRIVATGAIAGIAAWVSYWHMAGVAARYGEEGASPYLLPFSVDGLIVVASISLVELAGQIARDGQSVAIPGHDPGHLANPVAIDPPEVASPGQVANPVASRPVDGHLASELDEMDAGVDRAIAELGQQLATEAEALANAGQLPHRRAATPPAGPELGEGGAVPPEAIELLRAWDRETVPVRTADALLTAHFGVSARTVRRWRARVVPGS